MSLLFSPFHLRGIILKNRIVVSPMCQYAAVDGLANDWHLVHLGSRAVGGAALVLTEAVAVEPKGRISPADLGLWNDGQIEPLRRITRFIESQGAVPGIQLAHAGRKASVMPPWMGDSPVTLAEGGWVPVGPTDEPFQPDGLKPRVLRTDEIAELVAAFGAAASRACRAGFKVIEIHGAHGYLVNEFMSPLVNKRTDEYGGSFENRLRFLKEVVAAIRSNIPTDMPLLLRISASDWHEDGWQVSDSVRLGHMAAEMGIDLIDCSSGGSIPGVKIPAKPNYQVPFAEEVRKAGIPTGAVGIIVNAQQAEEILEQGCADLIFMARELLRNPYFPLAAAAELGDEVAWPVQYERAKRVVKK